MTKRPKSLKWIIWSLAAIFYLYEYFLRVSPSVMIRDLMRSFMVDATAVGFLSASYFYIYAPMQIPVGMLTDRFGARKLLASAAVLSGLGALLFGLSEDFSFAAFGRFLIGFGAAFGFVGIVYVASHWFSPKKRGVMIGLANTLGMLGAILGQGPLRQAIDHFGWRGVTIALAGFGILLGALIFFIMRDDPKTVETPKATQTQKKLWENFGIVCRNRYSWINALSALFLYVTTATFAGLWGIPYIHETYGVDVSHAGFIISMVFVGWAVGGPLIGIWSDKIQKKRSILLFSQLIGLFLMAAVIYLPHFPLDLLYPLFFLVGFVSSAQLLNFSYSIDINPLYAKGTAAAFTNFIVVIGTAIFQPLVGYLLDLNWTGQMDGAIRSYSPYAYKIAMTTFPLSFALGFIFSLLLKKGKTHESHGL